MTDIVKFAKGFYAERGGQRRIFVLETRDTIETFRKVFNIVKPFGRKSQLGWYAHSKDVRYGPFKTLRQAVEYGRRRRTAK